MRGVGRGVVGGVGGVFGAEVGAGCPALRFEHALAVGRGVVGPGCVVWVVADLSASERGVSGGGEGEDEDGKTDLRGPARPIVRRERCWAGLFVYNAGSDHSLCRDGFSAGLKTLKTNFQKLGIRVALSTLT